MMFKRYVAEFLGTFFIVFAPVALSGSGKLGGDSSLLASALVSGLSVLGMIYALGPICAAHFNPAVTLAFAATKRFPARFVVPYWVAQFSGAIAAGAMASLLFGPGHGAHVPAMPHLVLRNLGTETAISFLLMLVIAAVATDRRVSGAVPGLAIGLTVVVGVLIGGPITGGSMNPARSLGPAFFTPGALAYYWMYALGPCLGALLGGFAYEAVRLERDHAQGAPNELLEALTDVAAQS